MPSEGVDLGQPKDIGENKSVRDLPSKFDWSSRNVIGPILDQQRVNTCAMMFIVSFVRNLSLSSDVSGGGGGAQGAGAPH